jgi:hypothetical protein
MEQLDGQPVDSFVTLHQLTPVSLCFGLSIVIELGRSYWMKPGKGSY